MPRSTIPLWAITALLIAPIAQASNETAPGPSSAPQKAERSQAPARILMLGDSLTEGYGVAQEESFPSLLEKKLRERGKNVQIINAGIGGSTSASGLARLRWHLREKPDIMILALGANDGLRGLKPDEIKKNLAAVIQLAKKNGIRVVLAGMKMPPNYGAQYTAAFERVFTELAREEKVAFIPFLLEGVGGVPSLNQPDGIHPNEKGHEKIADHVLKHLIPIL